MVSEIVLDGSAVLALLNDELGAGTVAGFLHSAAISAVNLSEVAAKLDDAGVPHDAVREAIGELLLEVVAFDTEQAFEAGLLCTDTRAAGLSLGDRACLALAKRLGVQAVTADRDWERLLVCVQVTVDR